MNPIIHGLLLPLLGKMAVVAALLFGIHQLATRAQAVASRVADARDDLFGQIRHGEDPDQYKGPKWGEAGSRELPDPNYSSTTGEIYIWEARGFLLIGSEQDIFYSYPADILGWGLDRSQHVKDICTPARMFGGQMFGSRDEAQKFLESKITEKRLIPLTGGHQRGLVNGQWYNVTNAVRSNRRLTERRPRRS